MFDPREKIVILIDGSNFHAASRALGLDIDFQKLLMAFRKRGYISRAYYYTALLESPETNSIRPLVDWLDYNGFHVVTKPAKEFVDAFGRRKVRGDMSVELTVDALEQSDNADHFILASGDGDFSCLVEALQRRGRKVSVLSSNLTQPPLVSDELRRQADHFIELDSLRNEISRDPRP